ncbi:MAG: hypothetical protein ABIF77_14235 [bacterium]
MDQPRSSLNACPPDRSVQRMSPSEARSFRVTTSSPRPLTKVRPVTKALPSLSQAMAYADSLPSPGLA